jgi:hypothetical protein
MTLHQLPSLIQGKILDAEMSFFGWWGECKTNPAFNHECSKKYERTSGGMKVASLLNIFNCFFFVTEVLVARSILVMQTSKHNKW